MKIKVFLPLLFILGYDLLLAGQDTLTNKSDESKIHRIEIQTKCNEYLNAQDYRAAIDFLTNEITMQDITADEYNLHTVGYIYGLRGLNYYYLHEYDSALNDINKSIKIFPEWSDAYFFRGLVRFELGLNKSASADYLKAIKLEPNGKQYYSACGNVYLREGKYEDAIKYYTKYINLDTSWALPYYNRGVAKDYLQDYQGAVADLNKAIQLDPDPYYVSFLSDIYFRHNDIEAAIDITKYGLKIDSTRAFLYENLGRFYLEKGDLENAELIFSKCVVLDNENFYTPLNISMLYYNINDKTHSKKYLDLAKTTEPRLNRGMEGIREIEEENPGQCRYSDQKKETLLKMFEELK